MIILERDSAYADKLRKYLVILDGSKIGKIGDGQTQKFDVTPGIRTLYLQIDWCRSKKVTFRVVENKISRLRCGSNLKGGRVLLAIFYVFFLSTDYIKLEQAD
jgi:hypothetical protein